MKVTGDNIQPIQIKTGKKAGVQLARDTFSTTLEKTCAGMDANKSAGLWAELADKYDVRNATFDQLCEISGRLYNSGQISLFEHGLLIFDPSKSPQPIKSDICVTPAGPDGKRDWVAEYEARAEQNFKIGNRLGYSNNQKVLRILNRLA